MCLHYVIILNRDNFCVLGTTFNFESTNFNFNFVAISAMITDILSFSF